MRSEPKKFFELLIESVNYIIINYALSNMAMLFQRKLIFVLFFASEVWLIGSYWRRVYEITKNRSVSAALIAVCFLIHIGMVYFIGRVVGDIIPFKQ